MYNINTIAIDTEEKYLLVTTEDKEYKIEAKKGHKWSVAYELVELLEDSEVLWGEVQINSNDYETNLATTGVVRFKDLESALEQVHSWYYDSGYGTQELYGTIVMKDGTWFQREEYDGSEWWQRCQIPATPEWVL